MKIDFTPYLRLNDDGCIWWPLIDAVKLGAGYLPVRDDSKGLVPTLRANSNRVLASERTLLSMLNPKRWSAAHPRALVRDNTRYLEATSFLSWLAAYVRQAPDAGMPYPEALDEAVRRAMAKGSEANGGRAQYESLTEVLEPWFVRRFGELPVDLKERVRREIFGAPWDEMDERQRRSAAEQVDQWHDPAYAEERKFWWEVGCRQGAVEQQLKALEQEPRSADTEARRKQLQREMAMMERQFRAAEANAERERQFAQKTRAVDAETPDDLIPYPKALDFLVRRHGATPDELAAWVFMGPELGGLFAYLNGNERGAAKRFYYDVGIGTERDFDYLTPLMAAWFSADELLRFDANDRYLTGAALVERWSDRAGISVDAFIRAKIEESRLNDLHPITGGTQATDPGNDAYPPLVGGLFLLSEVEAIEAEDFPKPTPNGAPAELQPALVSAVQIRQHYVLFRDFDHNERWWKDKLAHASRNGLAAARVGKGVRGQSDGSMWRPDLVANWLLARAPANRGGVTQRHVVRCLSKFAGFESAAEDWVVPDE